MRRCIFILLLAFSVFPVSAQTVSYNGIRQDLIVDVRTPAEFNSGHLDGAINIPLDKLQNGLHAVPGVHKKSHILIYCRSGRRSAIARDTLLKQGFRHVYDGGGMTALASKLKVCSTLRC